MVVGRREVGVCLAAVLLSMGEGLPARAADLFFDFGPAQSAVWPGASRVTPSSQFTDTVTFGWRATAGLRAYARAYANLVENRSRGTEEPPPIWTNPITEDCIVSSTNHAFLIQAKPGEYEVYVVCGTSEPFRSQFFDFTVGVSGTEQRVQIEGGYQFRLLRFRATVDSEPLVVAFQPRSKWVCSAILAWPLAERTRIEVETIRPLAESIQRMPPEQWEK